MMDTFSHFAYEVPFWPDYVYPNSIDQFFCDICRDEIHGDAYSSLTNSRSDPQFIIHERCFNLPKEVTHPFHPHPLILQRPSKRDYKCNMCKGFNPLLNERFAKLPKVVRRQLFVFSTLTTPGKPSRDDYKRPLLYCCLECDYYLDVKCASLTPVKDHQNLFNHLDYLIPCQEANHVRRSCNDCERLIEGVVYFDPKSSRLLHESCANLPEEINHPFHRSHPLTLVPQDATTKRSFMCYACGRMYISRRHYSCFECGFHIDVDCAFLVPNNDKSRHDSHTHQHPLVECDQSRSVLIDCTACEKPCKSSVYVCIECHIVLDESCTVLPRNLQHPLDLQHPLILYPASKTSFLCNACDKHGTGFKYACLDCCFAFHTTCVWPIPLTINSNIHKHPLVFLEKSNKKIFCRQCGKRCGAFYFHCLQCKYRVHLHCLPESPHVLKHERHRHSLRLTKSPIKDHGDEDYEVEFYCNACEERRMLADPTYHCADCHFVAHIHCLKSEILSHLEISCKRDETNGFVDVENQATDDASAIAAEYTTNPIVRRQINVVELESEMAKLDKEIDQHERKMQALREERKKKEYHVQLIASVFGE